MISHLHYITQQTEKFSHTELAEFACKGGVNWVQLRVKPPLFNSPQRGENSLPFGKGWGWAEWKKIALEVQAVCKKYGATFIINDNVMLAKEIGADGVHLGLNDMNPKEARRILGDDFIIGGTAHNFEEAKFQIENHVDYIGIGPYRFTSTKNDLSELLGLEGIHKILKDVTTNIPFIAIGGIKVDDIQSLQSIGIYGVAVSSAINLANDISASAKEFVDALHKNQSQKINTIEHDE
jgi:thiamine-phosphate pyrophosphorylase